MPGHRYRLPAGSGPNHLVDNVTNLTLARRAVRLYSNDLVPKATNRFNQRAWLRSVTWLGDRWLLANPIKKESK